MALAMVVMVATAGVIITEAVKYTVTVEIEDQSSNGTIQADRIAREITVNMMEMLNQPTPGEASSPGAQMPHPVTLMASRGSSGTENGSTCMAGGYAAGTSSSSSTAMEVVSGGDPEPIVVRLGGGKCFHRLARGMAVKFQKDSPKKMLRMKLCDALKTSLKPCKQCGPEK